MILAVQVDGDTILVAGSGLASVVGLLSLMTTRSSKHMEALQSDNEDLRAENRQLRAELLEARKWQTEAEKARKWQTDAEKWQRRAQDWRRVNGDPPWPE